MSLQTNITTLLRYILILISLSDILNLYSQDITISRLDSTINSIYPDYAAILTPDSLLIYSSVKPDATEQIKTLVNINYLSRIFTFPSKSKGKFSSLPKLINKKTRETANLSFTPDFNKAYFTVKEIESKNKKTLNTIWGIEFKKGRWQLPYKLNQEINLPCCNSTQPSVALLPDGREILYFVSDREGGIGKNDIWFSILIDGKFITPINLGPNINSTYNEITPFYHSQTKTLYFSTDRHNDKTAFDIFQSEGEKNTWTKADKTELKVNSKFDDIFFSFAANDSSGYLTSNRPPYPTSKDDTTWCYDIYSFKILKKTIPILAKKDTIKDTLIEKPVIDIKKQIIEKSITTEFKKYGIVNLLLYFDNDYPNPKTLNTTTNDNYLNLVNDYIEKKEIYITNYTSGLKTDDKTEPEKEINNFFTYYIEKGKQQLLEVCDSMEKMLSRSCKLTLEIGGFASPLSNKNYNYNLSQRRIASFINFLNNYKAGIFKQEMQAGGKITIKKLPKGASTAPVNVSSKLSDTRNSVYSPLAARERRITISFKIENCP